MSIFTEGNQENSADFEKEFSSFFTKAYRLEKMYSNHCIKSLLPIWGENNVAVIGIHKETCELSFISFAKDNMRKLLFLTKFENNIDILRLTKDPSLVLFDDYRPFDFELEYLLKRDSLFQKLYKSILFNDASYVEYSYELISWKFSFEFIQNIHIAKSERKSTKSLNPDVLICDIVDDYFNAIKEKVDSEDERAGLIASIKDIYCQQFEQTSSLIKMYAIINSGIKSVFQKCSKPFSYDFDYEKRSESFDDTFTESILQTKMKAVLKCSFRDILNNYNIPYGNKINHGFASFKYAAGIFEILRNSIELEKTPEEWKIIDIFFRWNSLILILLL